MFESNIITQRFIKCFNKLKETRNIKSGRQFAMALDYLPQNLSEILKGRRDVNIELLRKAIEEFSFNPIYIFTGEGAFFLTEEDQKGYRVLTVVANEKEEESIVYVPAPAQSSYPNNLNDSDFIANLPVFTLPDYKFKTGTHRCFDITGDGMEPTLFEGDKVVCSFIEPALWESAIKDHYVYIIVTRGDIIARRVYNHIKEKKSLEIQTDNHFYEPTKLPVGEIREIWYVRAKISPFLPSPQSLKISLHQEVSALKETIALQSKMIQQMSETVKKMVK